MPRARVRTRVPLTYELSHQEWGNLAHFLTQTYYGTVTRVNSAAFAKELRASGARMKAAAKSPAAAAAEALPAQNINTGLVSGWAVRSAERKSPSNVCTCVLTCGGRARLRCSGSASDAQGAG